MEQEKKPVEFEQIEHLKKVSSLPAKKKFQYFYTYYKWYVIGFVAISIFLISMVKTIFFTKPYAIYGEFINAPYTMEEEDSAFITRYATDKGLDLEHNQLFFNSMGYYNMYDYASGSKMLAAIAAGEIDFLIAPIEDVYVLSGNEFLDDPTRFLSEQQDTDLKEALIWYDHTTNESTEDDDAGIGIVGIDISDSPVINETGCYSGVETIVFCIPYNAPHPENAVLFLEWLLNQ